MKTFVKTTVLAALLTTTGLGSAATLPAFADGPKTRPAATLMVKKAPRPASIGTIQAGTSQGATHQYPGNNEAKAWTAACYAEFGEDANYPDADMLEKCLNWGSE
ncbi:MAG: hypothetical protein AAGB15_05305 [Pseudomonadota bacterium]